MKKLGNVLQIAYLIVGTLCALEFIFVQGLFTWLMAVAAVVVVGAANVVYALAKKRWAQAYLYALLAVALCMGYSALI